MGGAAPGGGGRRDQDQWGDAPYDDKHLVQTVAEEVRGRIQEELYELVAQLHTGGVMVVPVNGTMLRVACSMRGTSVTRHGAYRFVPLR